MGLTSRFSVIYFNDREVKSFSRTKRLKATGNSKRYADTKSADSPEKKKKVPKKRKSCTCISTFGPLWWLTTPGTIFLIHLTGSEAALSGR